MLAYITVGVDDIQAAERFYSAILPALGYTLSYYKGDLSYTLPEQAPPTAVRPDFFVKRPFNGQSATPGNGTMVAFQATGQAQVCALHAAGVQAGGSDDGAPGFRADYGPTFYVAYLRDPQGNKLAIYSSNPAEPGRDD